MADLKSLLGDKYKEGMTIEELMTLDVDIPKPDMTGFISKDHFDKVASEAADYKKQLRAKMSEAEAKEKDEAEKYAAIVAERDQLREEKAIAENAKGLIAIGYDEGLATEVAKALYNGDAATVIKAQAKFVEAQLKQVKHSAQSVVQMWPKIMNANVHAVARRISQATVIAQNVAISWVSFQNPSAQSAEQRICPAQNSAFLVAHHCPEMKKHMMKLTSWNCAKQNLVLTL